MSKNLLNVKVDIHEFMCSNHWKFNSDEADFLYTLHFAYAAKKADNVIAWDGIWWVRVFDNPHKLGQSILIPQDYINYLEPDVDLAYEQALIQRYGGFSFNLAIFLIWLNRKLSAPLVKEIFPMVWLALMVVFAGRFSFFSPEILRWGCGANPVTNSACTSIWGTLALSGLAGAFITVALFSLFLIVFSGYLLIKGIKTEFDSIKFSYSRKPKEDVELFSESSEWRSDFDERLLTMRNEAKDVESEFYQTLESNIFSNKRSK